MNRADLEHIIRACATIALDDEIVVIGSQSILGQFPEAPAELLVSNEADVYPKNFPDRADLIDGSIGELSPFHESFGYYAQGVSPETATLPGGWETRLIPVKNENTRGATGLCLELYDLLISKYAAGREKDRSFTAAAARHGLAHKEQLIRRLEATDVAPDLRARMRARIEADFRH
jgi:hypothetical protein